MAPFLQYLLNNEGILTVNDGSNGESHIDIKGEYAQLGSTVAAVSSLAIGILLAVVAIGGGLCVLVFILYMGMAFV